MFNLNRRHALLLGLLSPIPALAAEKPCVPNLNALTVESDESPFFEHYHQIVIPVSALISPPAEGIVVLTTAFDRGSYDVQAFKDFVAESGLNGEKLLAHVHKVSITQDQLQRIGGGEKDVEVRVISDAKNYVHNFRITALQSALVKVRRGEKK